MYVCFGAISDRLWIIPPNGHQARRFNLICFVGYAQYHKAYKLNPYFSLSLVTIHEQTSNGQNVRTGYGNLSCADK